MDPLVPLSYNLLAFGSQQTPIYIAIIIGLVLCSAFFSAFETSLATCNRVRIKVKAEDGHKAAKLTMYFLDKFDQSLISLLIGNNVVNILASSLATILSIFLFSNEAVGTVVSTIVMTIAVFMFGEVLPKNIAKANPDRMIMVLCFPMLVVYIVTYPIMQILNFFTWVTKKIFRLKNDDATITEDEFQGIVETVEEEGGIDEEESDIIQAAVEFGDITVKDVLTPLDKVVALNIKKTSRKEIIAFLQDVDFSRIPVYSGTPENIIGILHVRNFLKLAMKSKNFTLKSCMSEVFSVSPETEIDEMVEIFKAKKRHMAIVKQNDKAIGLVTMEDVLEELVGEMEEETANQKAGDVKC